MSTKDTARIGIPDLLSALRRDLDQAQKNLKDNEALLEVDSAEVEVLVTISRSSEGTGSLNINVLGFGFGAGVKGAEKAQTAHKIKLSLKPSKKPSGEPQRIGVAGSRTGGGKNA